ncbi:isocitrate lyase/phosphoenolpyruvate mutase family protein [Actinoplanes oblitus]|uniref:Isocitrate lyase/phosphoenolpyruvate mutase family protein n=1 Tax=Actinoplanes oblitus TaxID=3040509 RepID=A0ABY8W8F0_9ACTN|nr:isocitrate lyase/phosphoenolpyruvate mutase family protein [Actinoplanes oblitus]WIM94149.1 isocitrate lyase/phosphoenolpyruvate mutase family protein [Actinoplanes oblitus]
MAASALRMLLAADRVTHVPGVWDPATAALAVAAGHQVVHLSGAAVAATMLGRPDLGFVHATQIADRATTLAPALRGTPLLADADTGFGTPEHAVWTGLAYRRSGISGLLLEDRASPDRRERRAGPKLIEIGLAAAKIKALADQVPELTVIARTDAYAGHGLAETIVRCGAYAEAGAHAVVPEGVPGIDELAAIHRALPGVPMVLTRSEAAPNRPAWTDADLLAVGVRLVLHPVAALLAAMRAASTAYRAIGESGAADAVERMPWAAFTAVAGEDDAAVAEARYVPGRLQT